MSKAKWKNFSDDELREIVKNSISFQQVKKQLGYASNSGSSTEALRKVFKGKNIDYSHFTGQSWNKKNDIKTIPKTNRKRTYMSPTYIKNKYIETHEYKCQCCGISIWNNKPITLQLHHIDGNRNNNEDNNLMLLCPNCHSQTDNFCGKNYSHKVTDEEFLEALKTEDNICAACRSLNISPNQSNYARAKRLLAL